MTTKDLIEQLGLKPLSKFDDREVSGVFVSDMVSDVMAGAKSGNLWLTVQTHKSIVPAANLVDVSAIIITSDKDVPRETTDLASKFNIAILATDLPTFELVGKLYGLGLGG
jgi:serine kinase of HPr protein (carbohydrate metabolism regulator)